MSEQKTVEIEISIDVESMLDSLDRAAESGRHLQVMRQLTVLGRAVPKVDPIVMPGTFVWGSVVSNA